MPHLPIQALPDGIYRKGKDHNKRVKVSLQMKPLNKRAFNGLRCGSSSNAGNLCPALG